MRKLFMTDIHGCYNEMVALLKAANFTPEWNDQLVIGGDMIDRGPDSAMVLKQLKSLQDRYPDRIKVLIGNHEEMMGWFFAKQTDMWLSHGREAILSFESVFTQESFDEHIQWAITRPPMMADDEYIYVHAGIDPLVSLTEQDRSQVIWMPYTAPRIDFKDFTPEQILTCTGGKKVISGHIPRGYVFDDGARIRCDLGAGTLETNSKLALVDLTNDKYWCYDFDGKRIYSRKIARKKVIT